MTILKTPWTKEQVKNLLSYQICGVAHPYTCGNCRKNLYPTESGWRCECGKWEQDWCHKSHAIKQFTSLEYGYC